MMLGLLLSLLTAPIAPTTLAAEVLKTASLNFNSEAVPEDTHSRLRDKRFMAATAWIRENQPDIIFIVEGWNYRGFPSIIKALAMATGYDYTYRLTMGVNGLMLDSNGVLIKPGHRFADKQNFKLPHASMTIGDGQTWIISPGATSWGIGGKIITAGGNTVYAYATHLIGADQAKRSDQLIGLHRMIEKEIQDSGESVDKAKILIAGDLNESPASPAVGNLKAIGYQDSFLSAHPEAAAIEPIVCTFCSDPTTENFNPMSIAPNQVPAQNVIEGDNRIDYILSHGPGMKVLASSIAFTETLNGVWMSDHFGMKSTFVLGETDAASTPVVANPYRDRTRSFPPSRVIEVTPDQLFCNRSGCSHSMGPLETPSATGVTFINSTKHMIHVDIEGTGRVWPSNFAFVGPGKVAAFFFDEGSGQYSFDTHHLLSPKVLRGDLLTK